MLKKRHIIAAVSGGTDSMALLCILNGLKESYGYTLSAMHFNHEIRGEEADRDERFVADYCAGQGIECVCGRGDTLEYAREHRIGTEEAGRILRYRFFEETAGKLLADCVAIAHNADDNAETVLMNIARGSGASGLRGIPPVRDIYIRPLLVLTRSEIEEYSRENSIPHVEDSTNETDIYTRNRVRHSILPALREINGGFSKNVLEMSELLRSDEAYLEGRTEEFIEENFRNNSIDRRLLREAPIAISSRAIRKICGNADIAHVSAILKLCEDESSPSASADIPGMRAHREYENIVFGSPNEEGFEELTISPDETKTVEGLSLNIVCRVTVYEGNVDKSFTSFVFKKDTVCGKILIRRRNAGDRININGGGSKTLKKLLIDKKIPAGRRDFLPVIEIDGKTAGVYSVGADVFFRPKYGDEVISIVFTEINNEK